MRHTLLGYPLRKLRANREWGYAFLWILVCSTMALAQGAEVPVTALCPNVSVIGELSPGLNDTELRLVCGEGVKGDAKTEAWQKIPINQARFHFKNFLQDRGYHNPEFEAVEGMRLIVRVGEPTRVTSLEEEGAPPGLYLSQKRRVVGEILTPRLLSSTEGWVSARLQALGYPCPEVTSEGDPETGKVLLHVRPGPRQKLISIVEETVPGVQEGIFRRYDAFRLGEFYNGDWMTVTANRVVIEDLVQSSHFTVSCSPGGAIAKQEFVAGPPRLLTFGFGLNTEGLFLLKSSWRNARLGNRASWIDLTALGSTKEQRLTGTFNWYFLPRPSRMSIRPVVEVRHQNENPFELITLRGNVAHFTTWDSQNLGGTVALGPTVELFQTLRGIGPLNSGFTSLETDLRVTSHSFEFFRTAPRTGFTARMRVNLADQGFLSTASAQRFAWEGQGLINLMNWDPPVYVLGFRGGYFTTLTSERPGPESRLPPTYRHFLGGSTNLRGFGRQQLPENGSGGLSAVYAGLELRLVTILPAGLEPFVFHDFGALGERPFKLDSPVFRSPGVGLRWASPIGVFRTTLARGLPNVGSHRWQFYLSYGEEF